MENALQNSRPGTYYSEVNCQGTSFRFECEMVNPLISHLPALFQLHAGQRARLLRQQPIGSVIPDLLLGIWTGELPQCTGLNAVSRHILAWLSTHKSASTEEKLRDDLFLSRHAADSAVSTLTNLGALSKRDSGEVELRPEFEVLGSVRLIAIEMKLKKWREALAQAIEYRKFANEAYVVLDGSQVRMTCEVWDAFTANGVGLFLQRGGTLEEGISAKSMEASISVDRLFAVSKLTSSGPYCLA